MRESHFRSCGRLLGIVNDAFDKYVSISRPDQTPDGIDPGSGESRFKSQMPQPGSKALHDTSNNLTETGFNARKAFFDKQNSSSIQSHLFSESDHQQIAKLLRFSKMEVLK